MSSVAPNWASLGYFSLLLCHRWTHQCSTWTRSRVSSWTTLGSSKTSHLTCKASDVMSSLRESQRKVVPLPWTLFVRRDAWRCIQLMQQFQTASQKHILIQQIQKVFSSSVPYGFIEAVGKTQKASQLYYGDFSFQNIFWKHAWRSQLPPSVTA